MKKLGRGFKDKPGQGITCARAIHALISRGLISLNIPKQFAMRRGKGMISALKVTPDFISGRRKGLSLTLP